MNMNLIILVNINFDTMIDNDVSGSLVLKSKQAKIYFSVYSPNTFIKKHTMSHVYQNVRIKKLHFVRTCECACMGLCMHGSVRAWVCACMGLCVHGSVPACLSECFVADVLLFKLLKLFQCRNLSKTHNNTQPVPLHLNSAIPSASQANPLQSQNLNLVAAVRASCIKHKCIYLAKALRP